MKHIMVMLAVNDHRNGDHVGRLRAIKFSQRGESTPLLALDSYYLNSDGSRVYPACSYNQQTKRVQIGARRFEVMTYFNWVGNWCWDAVIVQPEVAARLFNYLCWCYHSKFSAEGGTELFGELWKTREFVTAREFLL